MRSLNDAFYPGARNGTYLISINCGLHSCGNFAKGGTPRLPQQHGGTSGCAHFLCGAVMLQVKFTLKSATKGIARTTTTDGQAPNSLLVAGGSAAPKTGRTRPVCVYPQRAIYNGR
jgi:hypothetical protein